MTTDTAIAQAHKRQHEIIGIQVGFTVFSGVVLTLRLWSRAMIQAMPLGADDWTILVAWLLSLVFAIDVCMQTRHGLGFHVADLPPGTDTPLQLKLYFIKEPIYYFVVSLTKVSILFLYLKLTPNLPFKRLVWAMMAFVMLTAISISIAGVFQCTPISKAWNTMEPGWCFARIDMFLANAALNIAQDIIVYFMPLRMLWGLNLPKNQRLALVLVFAMGGFVIITGFIRVPSLIKLGTTTDPTWDDFDAALWSSVEMNVGIVCASLVHFKALFARYWPHFMGVRGRSKYQNSGGPSGPPIRLTDYHNEHTNRSAGRDLEQFGGAKDELHNNSIGVVTELSIETKMRTSEGRVDEWHYFPGQDGYRPS